MRLKGEIHFDAGFEALCRSHRSALVERLEVAA